MATGVSSKVTELKGGLKVNGYQTPVTYTARYTVAQINAGVTVLPAIDQIKYRLLDFTMIAIGGNAATATGVYLKGTQATSVVNLAAVAIAALTRSAVVKPNSANVTVLADAASFGVCDANTAITFIKNGSDLATATHVELTLTVALDEA